MADGTTATGRARVAAKQALERLQGDGGRCDSSGDVGSGGIGIVSGSGSGNGSGGMGIASVSGSGDVGRDDAVTGAFNRVAVQMQAASLHTN